jgi:hypothetical protein
MAAGSTQPQTEMSTRNVRFDVFTEVTMKYDAFWDVTACGSCKNRRRLASDKSKLNMGR